METTGFTPADVWSRLGVRMRPMRGLVAVVTDLPAKKIGSIFLPTKLTGFYGNLPHLVLVRATVLSVGPQVTGLQPGDRVAFPRTYFTRWQQLEPDVMVGWVDSTNISGRFSDSEETSHVLAATG